MKQLVIIIFVCFALACSKDKFSPNSIIGEWKETEVYANNGASGSWMPVSDGFILKIETDSTYTTTTDEFPFAKAGKIDKINDSTINVRAYLSSSSINPIGFIVKNDMLELGITCIEGCGIRFKRIK